MREEKALKISEVMKLISDPGRVQIMEALLFKKEGMCVNEIAKLTNSTHSATSHQLAKLERKGVVSCFREGQNVYYEVRINSLTKQIKKIIKVF